MFLPKRCQGEAAFPLGALKCGLPSKPLTQQRVEHHCSEHPPAPARSTLSAKGWPSSHREGNRSCGGVSPYTSSITCGGLAGLKGSAVTVLQPGRAQFLEEFVRQRENGSKEHLNHGQDEQVSLENWGEKLNSRDGSSW